MSKTRKATISSIAILALALVIAVLMTRAQLAPTVHAIGTVVMASVCWGWLMGWLVRGSVDESKAERGPRLTLRGANDEEMDSINAAIRREWNTSQEDAAWKDL